MGGVKGAILIIDDERTVHESCARVLQEEGYEVDSALSGMGGLQKLREKFYDLVLLDIKMADLDGLKTLEAIKKERSKVTVVMITGYPSLETARVSMRLGAFDYLAKPFDPDELLRTVEHAIRGKTYMYPERDRSEVLQKTASAAFTVSSVMRSKLVTCSPDCSIKDVTAKMIHENVRSILVKQGEEIAGIIVDKNILTIIADDRDFHAITASEIMSSPLECCDADDSLETCMELFEKSGHSRLVVIKHGRVVGIVLKKFVKRFLTLSKRFSLAEISHRPHFRTGR